MTNCAVNLHRIIPKKAQMSLSKRTGLRSMQNIKGTEREIIEAYRNELSHDIWGNPQKLYEWAVNKFNALKEKKYTSKRADGKDVEKYREEDINAWADLVNSNDPCKRNPFLKLKIFKSIVENLKENNSQLPPAINENIFNKAVNEARKFGKSFKKTYFKLYKEFSKIPNLITEDVSINGVRGRWYSLKLPDYAEAAKEPGTYKKILEFISILSQGSNWCTKNSKLLVNDFAGKDFHIFTDTKGIPQICMVGSNKHGGHFKYIKGNDQYAKLDEKYKDVLKDFLERRQLNNAVVGETDRTTIPIADLFK